MESEKYLTVSWIKELIGLVLLYPTQVKQLYPEVFGSTWTDFDSDPRGTRLISDLRGTAEVLLRRNTPSSFDDPDFKAIIERANYTESQFKTLSSPPYSELEMAAKAMDITYMNSNSNLNRYMEFVSRNLYRWASDTQIVFHSMYHSIVNGSMMGKTRLITEIAKNRCLVVYLNLSPVRDVFPQPYANMIDWFREKGAVNLKGVAQQNIMALVVAIGESIISWLQENQFDDHPALFRAWHLFQNSDSFWYSVRKSQASIFHQLDFGAKVWGLSTYGETDEVRNAAKQVQAQCEEYAFNQTPGTIPVAAWDSVQVNSHGWLVGLSAHFLDRMSTINKRIHKLLWDPSGVFEAKTAFVRDIQEPLLESWGKAIWPTWLFVLDECRSLLEPVSASDAAQKTIFHNIRLVARYFPRRKEAMALVVMDTTSRISNFASGGDIPPSSRFAREIVPYGNKLFPPFWDLRTIDVHEINPKRLKDILYLASYAKYGRAALKAFHIGNHRSAEFMNFLGQKLRGTTKDIPSNESAYIGILSFLVCFYVQAYSPLAEELVGSFMQRCAGISHDRYAVFLRAVPEPAIGMAARMVVTSMKWISIFKALNKRGATDIDVGAHGEVALQILLLMASQAAEEEESQKFTQKDLKELQPIVPVHLHTLLKKLGLFRNLTDEKMLTILQRWEKFLKCSHYRLVQFTKSFSQVTPEHLLGRYCRANGIMSPRNATGVDGFLALYVGNSPLSNVRETEEPELLAEHMSHVGLQFKNYSTSAGPKSYETFSTVSMNARRVLGHAAIARNHLPYLSLVLDAGRTSNGKPKYWVFDSEDPQQLSIVIRGLRPSHVMNLEPQEAADLDREFERFLTGPSALALNDREDLRHAEADLFFQSAEDIADTYGIDLIQRAKAILDEAGQYMLNNPRNQQWQVATLIKSCTDILSAVNTETGVPLPHDMHRLCSTVEKLEELVLKEKNSLKRRRIVTSVPTREISMPAFRAI